jgi:trk system potassium uptake protein TrkH
MTVRVDWRASLALVGTVVRYLAVALLVPLATAVIYGEGIGVFLATIAVALSVGTALERLHGDPGDALGAREGFLMVALTWLAVALVSAVPYLLAAHGIVLPEPVDVVVLEPIAPTSTLGAPANAVFESMSGVTTTGATVMGKIAPEKHSHAVMLWRQQTQWLGGMGIVVLAVAILPELSVGGAQLMDAEAPGPGIEKLTPRIAETARALWGLYAGITLLEIVLLVGLHEAGFADNMTIYNAVAHGLTTMPTGGFSPEARSIEAFSAAVQWLIIPFMIAAGTNFALFWHVANGDPRTALDDTEFRFYGGILGVLAALGTLLLFVDPALVAPVTTEFGSTLAVNGDLEAAARHALFQVVSIVTTTGYASMDFNAWSGPGKALLVFAMFVGGSAGSTGGAIKIVRWLVIVKSIRRELFATVHPDAVQPVRLGGRPLNEDALRGIYVFTLLYVALFLAGIVVLSLDAALVGYGEAGQQLSTLEALTASAATIGNIGPGLEGVGPMGGYAGFTPQSKLFMVVLMWVGRLEIFPVLVLLTDAYWRS